MTNNYIRERVSPGGVVRFEARWRDETGTQRQRSFRTKKAALKFQVERKADEVRGLIRDEDKAALTFDHYASEWLADKRLQVRPVTVAGYSKDLRLHALPFFGTKPIGKITTSHVLDWVRAMSKKRVGDHSLHPSTIKSAFVVVDQVLRSAVLDGAIHINPATGVRLPKRHAEAPAVPFFARPLTEAEQAALVGAMAERDKSGLDALVTALFLGTGLRAAELAGLEVGDVSILNRTISITRTKTKVAGQHLPVVAPPKSERSTRVLPLGADLAAALEDWLEWHPLRHTLTAPLFPARKPNRQGFDWERPIETGTFRQRRLRPALVAAGLPAETRLHDLRHSFGSTLVENGAAIEKVSRLMGHSSVAVTDGIYVKLNTAAHHDVVDSRLPSLLARKQRLAEEFEALAN